MNTNYTNKNNKLIYPELSYTLAGICFDVHNTLGRFCREKQYSDALEEILHSSKIIFERETRVGNTGNILDFKIENKIILEIKAKPLILKDDFNQLQRYLQITDCKLGLLVNFRNRYLKPIRIVKIETDVRKKFLD